MLEIAIPEGFILDAHDTPLPDVDLACVMVYKEINNETNKRKKRENRLNKS